jgi:hypothetical protein
MVTNNFLKWLKGSFAYSPTTDASVLQFGATLTAIDGKTITRGYPMTSSYMHHTYGGILGYKLASTLEDTENNAGVTSLLVGSGTTEPTANDIALESIISGLKQLSFNMTKIYNEETQKVVVTFTREIKNITGEEITVSEMALYLKIRSGSTSNSTTAFYCFAREKLASSLTVGNNETFTVSLSIEI